MKALVTGASGFIGSALVEELNTLGFEVHALMRASSSPANLEGLVYRRVEGDMASFDSLKRAVEGMDYVFHLAGATAAPGREAYLEANARATERLARAAAEAAPGLKRFVYVSSLAAGGPARGHHEPRTESQADAPVSAYGESKLEGERALLAFRDRYPISIVRPPIVYGPRDKGVFVLIRTVARNFMPIIQGGNSSGKKYYSAIYVRDLCRGIVQAAVGPAVATGGTFYLCHEDIHSYEELLSAMAEALDCDPYRLKIPQPIVRAAAWTMEGLGRMTRRSFPLNSDKLNEILPDYWICSPRKAKEELGFAPEFDLAKGMARTVEWYRAQRWI